MLTALLVLCILGAICWLGFKIIGAVLSAVFWLCIKLPLSILFGGFGFVVTVLICYFVGRVILRVFKGLICGLRS